MSSSLLPTESIFTRYFPFTTMHGMLGTCIAAICASAALIFISTANDLAVARNVAGFIPAMRAYDPACPSTNTSSTCPSQSHSLVRERWRGPTAILRNAPYRSGSLEWIRYWAQPMISSESPVATDALFTAGYARELSPRSARAAVAAGSSPTSSGGFRAMARATGRKVATRKLTQLEAAATLEFLRSPPGNRLEALKGDRQGQYSIRVYDQWRICFPWTAAGAEDVEIVDYH